MREPDPELQRRILDELEDGPKSFDELRDALFGCEACGQHDTPERRFRDSWGDLHDQHAIHLTVDRRLALGGPTGISGGDE